MTPEQRLDRAERILLGMIKSGRRTRSEWQYKVNSLIDAQIRHETNWRAEHEAINEKLNRVAVAQAELTKAQKLTDKELRAFIKESRQRRANGKS